MRATLAETPVLRTEDVQALVHELSVYQMELELQNEQLREAQAELAHTRDRFADLYDFAPVGYVTLNKDGDVVEANLTAATMLGVERKALLGTHISKFVDGQSQDNCYLHRQTVFAEISGTDGTHSSEKHVGELNMHKADGRPFVARLESVRFEADEGRRCRTAIVDITLVRRAQRQLKESEQRFRRLTSALTDYIFRVSVENGRAVETVHGPNCEAVTGYTPADFRENALLWISMVPEEDRALVEQQVRRILTGEDAPAIEHRIRRKDGAVRWVLKTVSTQRDDEGKLVGYDGLIRDVTPRKEAELALQQLNETLEQRVAEGTREIRLLAEAVSHLGEGVVITDDELDWPGPRISFVNEAMCRISGYTADELVGQTPRMLQGRESDRETLGRLKRELAAGRSYLCELVNYRKDGTPYHAELFISPLFDAEGRRTNFVSIHRDITERKRAEVALREREERLRTILNTAADAIVTIDQRGIINSVNPATEQMFGFSQRELVGQNVKLLMPPPYCDEHDGYIARYLATGEARIIGIGREMVGRHKDGSTFPIDLAVNGVDNLGLFTGVIRDIRQRKLLEREIIEISTLEQQRIGQDIHDGLGQQLTGISMLAKSLARRLAAVSPAESDAATQLNEHVQQAVEDAHRLSSGLAPVEIDPQSLGVRLRQLCANVQAATGLACRVEVEEGLKLPDASVATHLYRIAQESLQNAVKHAHAKQTVVRLETVPDSLTLTIRDDGVGMSLRANREGRLGLHIMRYRADIIGATFDVSKPAGGGTQVRCRIPRTNNHG